MNLDAFFDKIISRIKLIVGQCVIQACKYRDGEMVADVELLAGEKRRGIEVMQQFGFSSRPKGDVDGIALFVGGSRNNGVIIAMRGECPKLKEGEVMVHSPFGSSVYLKEDGSIEMNSVGDIVANPGNGAGKLIVNGSVEASLDVKANAKLAPVSLALHTHTSAAGPTNAPTPSV